jgi:hypothetical protein
VLPVDVYESERSPRRNKEALHLGWIQRKQVLRRIAGATDEEMREAVCEVHHIKEQRTRTLRMLPFEFLEIPLQSVNRKVRRRFGLKR